MTTPTASRGTITDLHSSAALPEVEVISLLAEDLPRYKLRADYLTEFGGYGNRDFVIETPVLQLPAGTNTGLTAEQAEATLQYFVSCGDRLSQMTKTYHDVEAVTRCVNTAQFTRNLKRPLLTCLLCLHRLLEEKEKDLELAAKIGQELLERNRLLDETVAQLENQVASSTELITQLKHELQVKTELLRAFNSSDDAAADADWTVGVSIEALQRKIASLESDNKKLHEDATEVREDTFRRTMASVVCFLPIVACGEGVEKWAHLMTTSERSGQCRPFLFSRSLQRRRSWSRRRRKN